MPAARPCTVDGEAFPSVTKAVHTLRSRGLRVCEIAERMGRSQQSVSAALAARPRRHHTQNVSLAIPLAERLDAMAQGYGMTGPALARRLLAALVEEPGTARELLEDHP